MKVDGKPAATVKGKVAPPATSPEYDGADFKFTVKKSSYLRVLIKHKGVKGKTKSRVLGIGKLYLNTVADGTNGITVALEPPQEYGALTPFLDEGAAVDLELTLKPITD
jgi:hypothetical protein